MELQPHHLCALSLSLAAHVALGLAIGIPAGPESGAASSRRLSTGVLTVHLRRPDSAAGPSVPELAGYDKAKEKALDRPAALPRATLPPTEERPIIPVLGQPEPHYFRSQELTEKPRILQDISPGMLLELPGVPPQSVVLRLLINERGDIDRVAIEESYLPEHAAQLVVDALSKLKFDPGRIDVTPVKSQLKIEVMLEDAVLRRPVGRYTYVDEK